MYTHIHTYIDMCVCVTSYLATILLHANKTYVYMYKHVYVYRLWAPRAGRSRRPGKRRQRRPCIVEALPGMWLDFEGLGFGISGV